MIESWRVVKKKYLDTAFDGEGARRAGGRWNSAGLPAVYTAESPALAILEMLVHADLSLLPHYVAIPVRFSEELATSVDVAGLPHGWREHPGPSALRKIGDDWLLNGASLALKLPTAVAPAGWNYLLNPAHPKFKDLEIGEPLGCPLDTRLVDRFGD